MRTLRPSIWGFALILIGCGGDDGGATGAGSSGATSDTGSDGDGTGPGGGSTAATTDEPGEDTTAGSEGDTDSDSDSDTEGPPPCEAESFDGAGTEWSLPALGGQVLNDMAGIEDCPDTTNGFRYATTDLDGDGGPDLVLTRDCDGGGISTNHWRVHANDGSGFGAATEWSLPDLGGQTLNDLSGINDCPDTTNGFRYTSADLTGDGRADLVLSRDCDGGGIATDLWRVYENDGSGFSATATAWSLPDLGGQALNDLAGINDCPGTTNGFRYAVVDLTEDGRADLVVTRDCEGGGIATDFWRVYENDGSGFSATATEWALPDLGGQALNDLAGINDCPDTTNGFRYATTDLTGDGRPDLVMTRDCDGGGIATDHWRVHENTGSGFSDTAITWTLPDAGGPAYNDLGGIEDCPDTTNGFRYGTVDLTADGLPDLVMTRDCDGGGIATDFWRVFPNDGDGFAATGFEWPLPDQGGQALNDLGGIEDCPDTTNGFRFATTDLTGDARTDLVMTRDCGGDGIASDYWRVFAGVCAR
ncbi:MAG: hypothetical protein AAF799_28140 [Myxococcota bacterium]